MYRERVWLCIECLVSKKKQNITRTLPKWVIRNETAVAGNQKGVNKPKNYVLETPLRPRKIAMNKGANFSGFANDDRRTM